LRSFSTKIDCKRPIYSVHFYDKKVCLYYGQTKYAPAGRVGIP
jgi:hypothetical protein